MSILIGSPELAPKVINRIYLPETKTKVEEKLVLDISPDNLYIASHSDIHFPGKDMGLMQGLSELKVQLYKLAKIASNNDGNTILIGNGDLFEIIETYIWKYGELYSDDSGKIKSEENVINTFLDILQNNSCCLIPIQNFLKTKSAQLILVEGNHDILLFKDDSLGNKLRSILLEILMPDSPDEERNNKIKFVRSGKIDSINLYFEHGHRFDPYDYSEKGELTWGDWLSYVKVHLVKRVIEELQKSKGKSISNGGLPEDLAETLIKKIGNVEYIRSANAFGLYLKHTVEKYSERYIEKGEPQIARNIKKIFMVGSDEFAKRIHDTPFTVLGFPLRWLPQSALKSNLLKSAFMYGTSYVYSIMTHNNHVQVDSAERIVNGDPSIKVLTFGHTHGGGISSGISHRTEKEFSVYNSGTRLPVKRAIIKKGIVSFAKTEIPASSGCIFEVVETRSGKKRLVAKSNNSLSNRFRLEE